MTSSTYVAVGHRRWIFWRAAGRLHIYLWDGTPLHHGYRPAKVRRTK